VRSLIGRRPLEASRPHVTAERPLNERNPAVKIDGRATHGSSGIMRVRHAFAITATDCG
jgi:hypothetical protein